MVKDAGVVKMWKRSQFLSQQACGPSQGVAMRGIFVSNKCKFGSVVMEDELFEVAGKLNVRNKFNTNPG